MTKPDMWEAIGEDNSGEAKDFHIDLDGAYAIALVGGEGDDENLHGFVIGHHYTDTILAIHVLISPDYWGHDDNVELGKRACALLLELSGAAKLVASIPFADKEVLRYAQRVGFEREGVNKKSFLRGGELLDQYYVGLQKQDK